MRETHQNERKKGSEVNKDGNVRKKGLNKGESAVTFYQKYLPFSRIKAWSVCSHVIKKLLLHVK